jgi:IS1 family transposase
LYPCGIPLRIWIWTVVNHQKKGILLWNLGERSPETFEPIWQIIKCWHSFWYVTDGWKVDPMYIQPEEIEVKYQVKVKLMLVVLNQTHLNYRSDLSVNKPSVLINKK